MQMQEWKKDEYVDHCLEKVRGIIGAALEGHIISGYINLFSRAQGFPEYVLLPREEWARTIVAAIQKQFNQLKEQDIRLENFNFQVESRLVTNEGRRALIRVTYSSDDADTSQRIFEPDKD